jgi:2-hydroxy-3-keto-5-methylthiopentenyl-1-phosphate phosphatase
MASAPSSLPCQAVRVHLDWDGTISLTDTLATVAAICYAKNSHKAMPPWSHFSKAYMSDSAAHTASYKPRKEDRRTLQEEFSWLESLTAIERASVQRVEAAGIFASVTTEDIQAGAKDSLTRQETQLRPGLKELLQRLHETGGYVSIISVNWSSEFIKAFLRKTMAVEGWKSPSIAVYANEIISDGNGRLNRHFADDDRGIWTAGDKKRVLVEALNPQEQSVGGKSVYVGDSATDLDCLLFVDIGICIRGEFMDDGQKALSDTLARLKIPCRWIGEYREAYEGNEKPLKSFPQVLWWARDFQEITDHGPFTL